MKKKKFNIWWFLFSIFFLSFTALTIAYESGYYEANVSRKSQITNEKLKEFEEDIKNGKEIDIKNYVDNDYIDYSSKMSKLGNNLASGIDNFMESGLTNFFEFLGRLFV